MKRLIFVVTTLLFIPSLFAQDKVIIALETAVQEYNNAILNRNRDVLEKLTAPQLSFGHSSGKVENKKEFVDAVVNGPFLFLSIDISDQAITIIDKTAIVRHILSAKVNNNGTPGDLKLSNLMVWQKQKGKWKLIARQAVRM